MEGLLARFKIYMDVNSIPTERQPKLFLTNQNKVTFKLITTLAARLITLTEIQKT